MSRYLGPKNKLARREGIDLGLKTPGTAAHASLLRRLNITPGYHGRKRRKKTSDYGIQLREKQKVKRTYGILEKQFSRYFKEASKKRGNTGEYFLIFLETRLDNVVYRLGFAPTRASARQLVAHGHILVNERKVNIPSYRVKNGEVVSLKTRSFKIPVVKKMLEDKKPVIPAWLARKGPMGKVLRLPERSEMGENINEQLIIEFYSR